MDKNSRTQPSFRSMDVLPPKGSTPDVITPAPAPAVTVAAPLPASPPVIKPVAAPGAAVNKAGVVAQAGNVPLAEQKHNAHSSQPPMSAPVAGPAIRPTQPSDPDKELDHIIGEVDSHHKQPQHAQPHRQRPILVAVIALLVAVALAVVAVFAFHTTQKVDPPASVTDLNSANSTKQSKDITTDELGTFSQSVDQQMSSVNDTTDFNGTDISDQALGIQ